MAYRFTNTDKWCDGWFSELKPSAKLTFMYLCDLCDVAGFIEINSKRIAFDCGLSKQEVEVALGLLKPKLLLSQDGKYAFIRNFIKHQKNLPLNEKNNAHKGIIKRLEDNLFLFDFEDVSQFINSPSQAPNEPLNRGIGKGNSNEGDKGGVGEKEETWKTSYEIYKKELREEYKKAVNNPDFLQKMERYHPGIDIKLSLEKACVEFWSLEAGWKKKKASRTINIDWLSTFTNALNLKSNQVYKERDYVKNKESLQQSQGPTFVD